MRNFTRTILILAVLFCKEPVSGQSLFTVPQSFVYNSTNDLLENKKDSIKRFYFQGATTINSTEQLFSSLQGTQKFIFTVRLKNQVQGVSNARKIKNTGVDLSIGMNVLNLKPTGVEKDSFDLTSLMFPETGNFGLMITPVWHWYLYHEDPSKIIHRLSSEISFSLRQNKVNNVFIKNMKGDTLSGPENIDFSILNFNIMPIRYNFYYQPEEDFKVDFNIGLYFNFFNVPNEDAKSFNKLYPVDNLLFKENDKSNIRGVGFKMNCSINGFQIFADLRQNLKTDAFEDSNPFKGFIFNTGVAQTINVFSK